MFIKYLFPEKNRSANVNTTTKGGNASDSSDSGDESVAPGASREASPLKGKTPPMATETTSFGRSSLAAAGAKSQRVSEQVQKLDLELKEKFQLEFTSVRKAFLAIDDNHRGYITAESFAKYLGASKRANFDFTLLEILIKLHTKGMKTRVNYNDFCAWFGQSIEPTETFFFRHDSKKNPQFEVNMQKSIAKQYPNQHAVGAIITSDNLKEKLIQRTFAQNKSIKSAFSEWKVGTDSHVLYDRFKELIKLWGFVATETQIRALYDWLDFDKDGKLSFEDMKLTIGLDVSPQEAVYFRQNIRNSKNQPCAFEGCWENTLYNSKSAYCPLHQKVMKNSSVDLFTSISQRMPRQEWELFTSELIQRKYLVTLGDLSRMLENFINQGLDRK